MYEMKTIISRWLLSKYFTVKNFAFWKVGLQAYNFVVPVYKGVIPP